MTVVRFIHRGAAVAVDAEPTRTVLDWLREDARCTGTKEGCNEGDCGACTVVVAALRGGAPVLEPVNACIRFVPTLTGRALFTVEDVAAPDGTLHPVQQALVDCHGSQCGFCTPGFVMSLWAVYLRHTAAGTRPTRQQLADELAGNLCRCTGYRPILDAGERMFELPPAPFDTAALGAALRALAPAPQAADAPGWHAPRTLADFAALRADKPAARIVAGATDVALWVNKQLRDVGELLWTGDVAELQTIDDDGATLTIGAAASLEAAWTALVARWPGLRDLWLRFASPPIRNAGTLGGNIANGSPIGDGAPVLMALDARVVLRLRERVRELPLADFYTGYMANRLQPGELLQAVAVPLTRPLQLRAYKISKRFDSDISAVCAAFAIGLDGDGVVRHARFAYGGLAAVVRRATATEAAVAGRPWNEVTVQAAQAALAAEFQPLTDLRASAGYRLQVAQNLLLRCWLETRPEAPLTETETSVFARA